MTGRAIILTTGVAGGLTYVIRRINHRGVGMKYLMMLMLTATGLTATAEVNALKVPCQTVKECKALIKRLETRLAQAKKQLDDITPPPAIGPIVPDGHGNLMWTNYDYAVQLCALKGSRLPTAREYAKFAEGLGAQGISQKESLGYEFIDAFALDGKNRVSFYYNNQGYVTSQPNIGGLVYWTSSLEYRLDKSRKYAYLFSGDDGKFLKLHRRSRYLAVRCMSIP